MVCKPSLKRIQYKALPNMKGLIPLSSFAFCHWFGEIIKMQVVGYDEKTGQYQVKHLNAYGSFFTYLEVNDDGIYEIPNKHSFL